MKTAWYWFVARFVRHVVFGLLGGLKVRGTENVPKSGPLIIAPIHVSNVDPPIVGSSSPRRLRFMAKEELFHVPVLAPLIRSLGSFPVKRGENDTAAIRKAIDLLSAGNAVLVFPEGQRGDGVHMGVIQPGIAVLAKRSGAQIVPVGISGSTKMMPKGAKWPKRTKLTVFYAKPFSFDDVKQGKGEREDRVRFAELLTERLREACLEAGLELKSGGSESVPSESDLSQTPSSPTGL